MSGKHPPDQQFGTTDRTCELSLLEVSTTEQWQLHDYFQPSKDWSNLQLLQHRDTITKHWPGLTPASRSGTDAPVGQGGNTGLEAGARSQVPVAATGYGRQQDRILSATPVARPEIDAQKLARAFIYAARDRARRAAREAQQDEPAA